MPVAALNFADRSWCSVQMPRRTVPTHIAIAESFVRGGMGVVDSPFAVVGDIDPFQEYRVHNTAIPGLHGFLDLETWR
jgi:hypothetical protein